MPKKLKIKTCPLKKNVKVKDKKCKKCEYYNPKRWFSVNKEVDVFCTVEMYEKEKKYLTDNYSDDTDVVHETPNDYKDNKDNKDKKDK